MLLSLPRRVDDNKLDICSIVISPPMSLLTLQTLLVLGVQDHAIIQCEVWPCKYDGVVVKICEFSDRAKENDAISCRSIARESCRFDDHYAKNPTRSLRIHAGSRSDQLGRIWLAYSFYCSLPSRNPTFSTTAITATHLSTVISLCCSDIEPVKHACLFLVVQATQVDSVPQHNRQILDVKVWPSSEVCVDKGGKVRHESRNHLFEDRNHLYGLRRLVSLLFLSRRRLWARSIFFARRVSPSVPSCSNLIAHVAPRSAVYDSVDMIVVRA